jgi:LDH2 family malate/lactate/ureidoglycolate dehydrogenase
MPPWGGLEPILGTSPFAAGAPGGNGDPIVLDMSPAVITRGKIRRAEQRGEAIPLGCALDAQGLPTTDPTAALKGVVLPIGGPKGSGLAILMDIFSGIISGAAYAGDVGDQYKDFERPQNVGHFFLAMKSDLFVSEAEYRSRIETLARRMRNCSQAIGYSEIMLPGEPEARHEQERRTHGIPYHINEINALQAEAAKVGVPPLELSNNPI